MSGRQPGGDGVLCDPGVSKAGQPFAFLGIHGRPDILGCGRSVFVYRDVSDLQRSDSMVFCDRCFSGGNPYAGAVPKTQKRH